MPPTRPHEVRATALKAELKAIDSIVASLSTIREALTSFPGLSEDFALEFLSLTTGSAHEDHDKQRAPTDELPGADDGDERETQLSVADRIMQYFRENDNAPATAAEIVEATGLKLVTVQSVLRKPDRNNGRFVRERGLEGACWRAADSVADKFWNFAPSDCKTARAPE